MLQPVLSYDRRIMTAFEKVRQSKTGYARGFRWSIFRSEDGEAQAPDPWGGIDKGKSWIEDDEICNHFVKRFGGYKYCHEVYRNPEGNDKTKSGYLGVFDFGIFPFSVEE